MSSVDGGGSVEGFAGPPAQGPTLSGLFAGGFPVLKPVGKRDKNSHHSTGTPATPHTPSLVMTVDNSYNVNHEKLLIFLIF